MIFILSLFALAASSSFASIADIGAFAERQIAQSRFRYSRPSVVRISVQTCNSGGKVKNLQLRVADGTLRLSSLDLFYLDGQKERISGFNLEKGQASPWLPLANQENPCLSRIHLNVGANTGNKTTTVQIIGQWE